jgi:thiamine pyrophosphokinase
MTAAAPDLAVVVADGAIPEPAAIDGAWPGWRDGRCVVVAADGGARGAAQLGLAVDELVGDLDSIAADRLAALRADGVRIEVWPRDKDASDTELAVRTALRHRPGRMVILGASGGPRPDHALANVGLLGLDELAGIDVVLLDGVSRIRLVRGPADVTLAGRAGDLVSLLPTGGDVGGVRTDGLAYPLVDERLPAGSTRGLSNVRTTTTAHIRVASGRLLVIEVIAHPEVLP